MKKISTKINISILALTAAILAFVGVALIINITLDYYRDFEKTCTLVFESEDFKNLKGDPVSLSAFMSSETDVLNQRSQKEYYILKDGNIVQSSKLGGMIKKTPNLESALAGQKSSLPPVTAQVLDFAAIAENGYIVYIVDSKTELYESIFDISFLFFQALVLAIALAAVLSYFISKRLTASVKKLADGAGAIAAGDFKKIEVKSRDEIGRLCSIFNEMSEQIQKDYDRFEKLELSRREFVANASHELKTPLTVIKSYSQTLSSMDVNKSTQREFLSVIENETDRMTDIVGQLLQLSKLEEPVANLYTDTDLLKLCGEITASLALEAKKKNIEFITNGKGTVYTDSDKVKTVLTNLLTNAVNYSEQGKNIIIDISDSAVSVINFGIGIVAEDLPHIFERFYRTDKARNRGTGGTGLGLAIAKASAQAVGADITAQSTPGDRTVFTLEFKV